MGHCDSSAHASGYGGVCAADGRVVETDAARVSGEPLSDAAQGLKPPLFSGLMSRLKPRPPKNQLASTNSVRRGGAWGLLLFVRFYQIFLSPFFGGACKFYPSCSKYGYEAIARHGARRGSVLAMKRLLRCRPFTKGGHDPVPDLVEMDVHAVESNGELAQ